MFSSFLILIKIQNSKSRLPKHTATQQPLILIKTNKSALECLNFIIKLTIVFIGMSYQVAIEKRVAFDGISCTM